MKKMKILALSALLAFTGIAANAQKFTEGDTKLSFLNGQTKLNIEYNYDKMMVGDKTEAQYIKEKKAAYDAKEPGKGKRWEEKWIASRKSSYEYMFEELLNKLLEKENTGMNSAQKITDAKYTLVVKTVMTDPGFNAVVMKKNPKCEFEISFIETATKKVVAKGELKASGVLMGGSDWDFDPSNSIKECYAKAGKEVGKSIGKAIGK